MDLAIQEGHVPVLTLLYSYIDHNFNCQTVTLVKIDLLLYVIAVTFIIVMYMCFHRNLMSVTSSPRLCTAQLVAIYAPCPKPAEMNSAVCLFLLTCLLTGAQCRPNGAPNSACDGVGPNPAAHGAGPQNTIAPFVLTVLPTNGNYTPGMSYTGKCLLSDYIRYMMGKMFAQVVLVSRSRARVLLPLHFTPGRKRSGYTRLMVKVLYFQIKHCRHDEWGWKLGTYVGWEMAV